MQWLDTKKSSGETVREITLLMFLQALHQAQLPLGVELQAAHSALYSLKRGVEESRVYGRRRVIIPREAGRSQHFDKLINSLMWKALEIHQEGSCEIIVFSKKADDVLAKRLAKLCVMEEAERLTLTEVCSRTVVFYKNMLRFSGCD